MNFLGPFTELNPPNRHLFIDYDNRVVFYYDDNEKQILENKAFAVYDHQNQIKTYLKISDESIISLSLQANNTLIPKPRAYLADGNFQNTTIHFSHQEKGQIYAALIDKTIPNMMMPKFTILPDANCDDLSEKTLADIHQIISKELLLTMQQPRLVIFQYFIIRAILTGEVDLVNTAPIHDALRISEICYTIRFQYLDPTNTAQLKSLYPNIDPDFIQTAIQSILLQILEQLNGCIVNYHDFKPQKHIPDDIWAKFQFYLTYENLKKSKICFNQILNQGLYQNQKSHPLPLLEVIYNIFIRIWRMISYYFGVGHHAQVMSQVKAFSTNQQQILRQSLFKESNDTSDLKQISHYIQFR